MTTTGTTSRRVRVAAVVAALTVGLTSCGFLDDLKDAIADLVAGGIAFDTAGNVDVGGISVLRGGRTAESWTAKDQAVNQAIEDSTDQAIADFILKREQSQLGTQVVGDATKADALDALLTKQLDPTYPGGPYGVDPKKVPGFANYPKLGAGKPYEENIWTQYPKTGRLKPDGITPIQFSTFVGADLGRGKDNPKLYQVGAQLDITTKGGRVVGVTLTPKVADIPGQADILKGTSFAGAVLGNTGVAPQQLRDDDKDGNWTGGQVRADVKSEAEIFGVNPYSRTLEVQVNIIDGVVYFIATAPTEISLAPEQRSWFEQFVDVVNEALTICKLPAAGCGRGFPY